jgi:hypothetical protein
VCVVNIDNGFGAAYVAAMMVRNQAGMQTAGEKSKSAAGTPEPRAALSNHR